jgi:hypothetical protein
VSNPPFPHHVTARIWEFILPVARGERYEDPLQRALAARQLGTVDGCGSQLGDGGEVVFVELDLYLADLDQAVDVTKSALEEAGAPVGSELHFEREGSDAVVPFGTHECLAIFLDGVTLPDDVYGQSDGDALVARIDEILGPDGEVRSSWDGPRDTALYVYGPSAAQMFQRLEPVLLQDPQCQNARIVLRYGNPSLEHRMLHLPREQ